MWVVLASIQSLLLQQALKQTHWVLAMTLPLSQLLLEQVVQWMLALAMTP
jgi:hypothetical protein